MTTEPPTIEFWKGRWETGQTAFHEGAPNTLLEKHIGLVDGRERVLVPLCGKSLDLLFLAKHVKNVVGVEAVELACQQFVDENGLAAVTTVDGGHYTAGSVELWCRDFFALPSTIGTFDAVWDRAALVAIDPSERRRYVHVLREHLRPGGRILLVAFTYDTSRVDGPPFSLGDDDVRALFRDGFTIDAIETRPGKRNKRFEEAGVEIVETLYSLTRP